MSAAHLHDPEHRSRPARLPLLEVHLAALAPHHGLRATWGDRVGGAGCDAPSPAPQGAPPSPTGLTLTSTHRRGHQVADLLGSDATNAPNMTAHRRGDLKIKLTSIYVDDHEKALRFYTEVLRFTKKADFTKGHSAGLPSDHRKSLRAPSCNCRSTTTRRPRLTSRPSSSRASRRRCSTRTTCEPTTSESRLGAPSSPRRPRT